MFRRLHGFLSYISFTVSINFVSDVPAGVNKIKQIFTFYYFLFNVLKIIKNVMVPSYISFKGTVSDF